MLLSDTIIKILKKLVNTTHKEKVMFKFYPKGYDVYEGATNIDPITGYAFVIHNENTSYQTIDQNTFFNCLDRNTKFYDGKATTVKESGFSCTIMCVDYPYHGCVVQFIYEIGV